MALHEAWLVLTIIGAGTFLLALQRIRYEIVAVLMLLALGLSGVLPPLELFSGFASPAVVTVASALIIARTLYNSGVLDKLEVGLQKFEKPTLPFLLLLLSVSLASGFMNDIAALAVSLPIALSLSSRFKAEPSRILIPLAYASIMGGGLTMIGTASNIVMSSIASRELGRPLLIFEFTPVGIPLIGVLLILAWLVAQRVLPSRPSPYGEGRFDLPKYIAEVEVSEGSKFAGKSVGDLEREHDGRVEVVRIVRGSQEREVPHSSTRIRPKDLLVVKAEGEDLQKLVDGNNLRVSEEKKGEGSAKDLKVIEAVVLPGSPLIEKSARQLFLREWLEITLLGLARHGSALTRRVGDIRIRMGDVLLLEGAEANLSFVFQELKCAPLRARGVRLHPRSPPALTIGISVAAITLGALGLLPVEISLAVGAISLLLARAIRVEEAYEAVRWPIIIMIGALIPFGVAMQRTGADRVIAEQVLRMGVSEPLAALTLVIVMTTVLSNGINNVAAAVFMAPIALRLSEALGVSGFPLLMGVAFAAALPFLTPISHHSNLLVMEAGGYRFSDYFRFGAPLTIATTLTLLIVIPLLWPF